MKKVFIGVGHGGSDPGAMASRFKEADINLVMALAAAEDLTRHGVQVGLSREKDENDPLIESIREANAFAPDLAFDCHNNAGGGDGFEVYRQTGKHASNSVKLAQLMEKQVKLIGQNSRGVKTKLNPNGTDYFGWLRQLNCPAVLLEGAFIDNAEDVKAIDTIEEQKAFGVAYSKAALEYLGIEWQQKKTLTKGKSLQSGFFTNPIYAQAALDEARKNGQNMILVDAERYI